MKIGIVCNGFLGSTVPLSNALASDGDFVDLIILDGTRNKRQIYEALEIYEKIPQCIFKQIDKSKTRGLTHLSNQERIRLFVSKVPRKEFDGLKSIFNIIVHILRFSLSKIISQQKYDLLIVQDMHSVKLTKVFSKLGAVNVHSFHEITNRITDGELTSSVYYSIIKNIPIIVHSEYCKKELEQLNINRSSPINIPFGCFDGYRAFKKNDDDILRLLPSEDKFLLAYGYILDYKGLDLLYDSYLQIKENKLLNFKIVIAGSGYVSILDKIKDNEDFILINEWISNDGTATLFDKCKAVVCPYKSASQSGIPQTAFVFHKPVIATNVGAFGEIINNKNGRLVDSIETLSKAIIEMMNVDIDVSIGENYTWSNIKAKYIQLYNTLRNNKI